MKRWWAVIAKDYFTFTKKERSAVLILVILGILFYCLPTVFWHQKTSLPDNAFEKEIAHLKVSIDTAKEAQNTVYDEAGRLHYQPRNYTSEKKIGGELFVFDPNTIGNAGWRRLGLRDRTISTINNFLAKGYRFKQPGDIKKIYGLHSDEAERLIPYIRISSGASSRNVASAELVLSAPAKDAPGNKVMLVDINKADTGAFIRLNGIGSKLANRIITFREKLGGFVSVEQIGETYGLPDSTFEKIRPQLQCSNFPVHTININSADAAMLKTHPYIKWNIANAIVNYRQQHGSYKSPEELKKIEIIPEELYVKIAPYLIAD